MNGNGNLPSAVLTLEGTTGDWHPVSCEIDGRVRYLGDGFELDEEGRVIIDGHPYHLVRVVGVVEAGTGKARVRAQYDPDGYNILFRHNGGRVEYVLANPVGLDAALAKVAQLVTINLASLGTHLVGLVVPQVGTREQFGEPVAVCDGLNVSRGFAVKALGTGQHLPVEMVKENGEVSPSPLSLTGTAASDAPSSAL